MAWAGWGNMVVLLVMLEILAVRTNRTLVVDTLAEDLAWDHWFSRINTPRTMGLESGALRNLPRLPMPDDFKGDLLQSLQSMQGGVYIPGIGWNHMEELFKLGPRWEKHGDTDGHGSRDCVARMLFGEPADDLRDALLPAVSSLQQNDVVVGIHIRFGDHVLLKDMEVSNQHLKGMGFILSDPRNTSMKVINSTFEFLFSLWARLERKQACGPMRLRIAFATDIPKVAQAVKDQYGDMVLPVPSAPAMHSYLLRGKGHENSAAALVSQWFLLVLSDIVLQPVGSSFSDSAMWTGGQHVKLAQNMMANGVEAVPESALDSVVRDLCTAAPQLP